MILTTMTLTTTMNMMIGIINPDRDLRALCAVAGVGACKRNRATIGSVRRLARIELRGVQ